MLLTIRSSTSVFVSWNSSRNVYRKQSRNVYRKLSEKRILKISGNSGLQRQHEQRGKQRMPIMQLQN